MYIGYWWSMLVRLARGAFSSLALELPRFAASSSSSSSSKAPNSNSSTSRTWRSSIEVVRKWPLAVPLLRNLGALEVEFRPLAVYSQMRYRMTTIRYERREEGTEIHEESDAEDYQDVGDMVNWSGNKKHYLLFIGPHKQKPGCDHQLWLDSVVEGTYEGRNILEGTNFTIWSIPGIS